MLDLDALIMMAVVGLVTLGVWMARRVSIQRMGGPEKVEERLRRAGGRALMTFQGFVEPGVTHVIEAREEQIHDDEEPGGPDPFEPDPSLEAALRANLAEALQQTPIDPIEVRRCLADALRAGFDWRRLYDDSIQAELASRPYRAPLLPPVSKVAPWEG